MSPIVAEFLPQNPPLVNSPSDPDPIPDPIPKPIPKPIPEPIPSQPHISMINAAAYMRASKLPGSISFQLSITPDGTLARVPKKSRWIFLRFPKITMNLLMFSARVKLMRSHLIALTISKLIWRKVLCLLTECTRSLNQSSTHSVPLLRNMSI